MREAQLPPAEDSFDVIVCGGGTAGLPAAVAATRRGAKVAIIERYGFPGGNAATSIMPCWHGIQTHHSGLLREFGHMVEDFGVGPIPLKDKHIEPEVVKILFLKLAADNGIRLYLHHLIVGAITRDGRITAVVTESKAGKRVFAARVLIDATGDGDLCFHAGADFTKGDKGSVQAMSLRFRIGYVDFARFASYAGERQEFGWGDKVRQIAERDARGERRQGIMFSSRLDKLFDLHRDRYPDLPSNTYFNCSSIRPGELSVNSTRIYNLDPTNPDHLTEAEVALRRQAWEIWRFLRDNIPGFADSVITETAAQAGVRESRVIVGDHVLSVEEGMAGAQFGDSVQTCCVRFDSHDKARYETGGTGGLCDVPFGCFIPKGLEGVLTTGRCVSCDHLMNSAFRRMENAFQSGEVAGTAAALAAINGTTPRNLDVGRLQRELTGSGFNVRQTLPLVAGPG